RESAASSGASSSIEDVHVREACGRAAMADRTDLARLALSVAEGAAEPVAVLPADHVHRVPEVRRAALICHVLQHARDPAVAHLIGNLAGELEVVALLIDGPRPTILHDDAPLCIGHDVIERDVLLARHERDVGHALEGDIAPGLRERAAVRAIHPGQRRDPRGLLTCGLIILEYSVLDDHPLVGGDSFVIPGYT